MADQKEQIDPLHGGEAAKIATVVSAIVRIVDMAEGAIDALRMKDYLAAMRAQGSTLEALPFPSTQKRAVILTAAAETLEVIIELFEVRKKVREDAVAKAALDAKLKNLGLS